MIRFSQDQTHAETWDTLNMHQHAVFLLQEPKPAAGISDEKGEALPGWCPKLLDDVSRSLKDDAQIVSACASGGEVCAVCRPRNA